jgi:hypothetical protein
MSEPKKKRGGKAVKVDGQPATHVAGRAAAPKVFEAAKVAEELRIWWENGDGTSFMVGDENGGWSRWPKESLCDLMRTKFVRSKVADGEFLSQIQQTVLHVMQERRVEMVTSALAGYPGGIHEMWGHRVLVKTSPKLVEPREGEWETVRRLIADKLDLSSVNGPDQTPYFHGWMKTALEGLMLGGPGNFRPGQCLVFAGRRDCGKSRIQHQVITGLLGGRSADPGPYLFGRTDFNGEMFSAEHLMMEDPASSTNKADRIYLGEMLKGLVVNDTQRLHRKREDAVVCAPFFRVSISVNDDPDKLRVLPLLTPDIKDKLMIFLVSDSPLPMPTTTLGERAAFREAIARELPAYAWWLLNTFQIPEGMASKRFGVREWLHPGLATELFDDTPAAELLAILDAATFDGDTLKLWDLDSDSSAKGATWEGTAIQLEALLLGNVPNVPCSVQEEMRKWSKFHKLSHALARLEQDQDQRVAKHRMKTERRWIVARPS